MEKYFEINKEGQNIRCKLYYDKTRPIKKMVLFGHGFAGHKDNAAAAKLAERILSKYKGVALMTFNLPCHGDDVKKKILLSDCMMYLELVINHIQAEIKPEKLFSMATSFGGYLVLHYIAEKGNPFDKIVLRCPAINMYEVLTDTIVEKDGLDLLEKGKPVLVGFDRKVEITQEFLQDLKSCEIRENDYLDYADDILILHGTKDEVVDFAVSDQFAQDQVIEFVPVEKADHRFQNPACMEVVTKEVLRFFGLAK